MCRSRKKKHRERESLLEFKRCVLCARRRGDHNKSQSTTPVPRAPRVKPSDPQDERERPDHSVLHRRRDGHRAHNAIHDEAHPLQAPAQWYGSVHLRHPGLNAPRPRCGTVAISRCYRDERVRCLWTGRGRAFGAGAGLGRVPAPLRRFRARASLDEKAGFGPDGTMVLRAMTLTHWDLPKPSIVL